MERYVHGAHKLSQAFSLCFCMLVKQLKNWRRGRLKNEAIEKYIHDSDYMYIQYPIAESIITNLFPV